MTKNRATTIAVIDDNRSVRKALTRLLQSAGYTVKAYADAREFLERDVPENANCILLDIKMPGLDGMELQERLSTDSFSAPIIFLTGHGDVKTSVSAIKKGALNFLEKPVDEKELLTAVEDAIAMDKNTRKDRAHVRDFKTSLGTLTRREYEVFQHVVVGERNKHIAETLNISEKTVKVHRGRIMTKFNVQTAIELARIAEKIGISPTS